MLIKCATRLTVSWKPFLKMPIFKSKMCPSAARVDGKVAIVTGANTGIGKETAKDLVNRGARVILACRDLSKAEEAIEQISNGDEQKKQMLSAQKLDLASLASIKHFSEAILEAEPNLHILINNAGIMFCPQWKTEDGFEMQFGVNHLGTFLLTNLLLDRLRSSAPSRIVVVSSVLHEKGKINFEDLMLEKKYDTQKAYAQSKLANILFVSELAKRLQGTGVTTYSLHPGVVKTDLWRYSGETLPAVVPWMVQKVGGAFMKTPVEGAQTSVYCAVAEELADRSGLYYSDCAEKRPSSAARNEDTAKKLWDVSCGLVGLEDSENGAQGGAAESFSKVEL